MLGIYKIENRINGKVYIGSGNLEDRKEYHFRMAFSNDERHNSTDLAKAIRKYGKESFSFEILEALDDTELLNEKEKEVLNSYEVEQTYNMRAVANVKRGVDSSRAKLNEEQLLEIIDWLMNSKESGKKIAERHNVCQNVISEINLGKAYRLPGVEYPIRNNNKKKFTKEEVLLFRKEFKEGKTVDELISQYSITTVRKNFVNMLVGKTYKNY